MHARYVVRGGDRLVFPPLTALSSRFHIFRTHWGMPPLAIWTCSATARGGAAATNRGFEKKGKKEKMHEKAVGSWQGDEHLIAKPRNLVAGPYGAGACAVVLGAADFCFAGSAAPAPFCPVPSCSVLSRILCWIWGFLYDSWRKMHTDTGWCDMPRVTGACSREY